MAAVFYVHRNKGVEGWKESGLPIPVPWGCSNLFLFMNSLNLKVEMLAPTALLGRLFMALQGLMFKNFLLMSTPHCSKIYLFMASL